MTAATTQLTIRVILTPAPVSQPAAVSQYRWDRILLVATLSIIAIGFAFTTARPTTAPMTAIDTSDLPPVDVTAPATTTAELIEVETHAVAVEANLQSPVTARADAPPPDTPAPTPGPTAVLPQQPPAPGLTAGATQILSGQVQRFLITNGVRANEPQGSISEIAEDPRVAGLLKVYAFADVKNLAGETLHYRWLRDNAVAADIEVEVGSARWRSYTSKYLNGQMRGAWRVELRDSAGQILASTAFEY